ncbi:hypothetical protein [Rhizobium sp. Root482]|uniref:hypothetical protein n=1 Tax=Rhizobium sp. Root482 TaxID=1736543 RepID=UPI0006F9AD38|nr:hypothetical protein [Rhizobium sp. Root482]KQY27174.1 hypothetical protein ASD31_03035 [Rhizobium sp. Root482]
MPGLETLALIISSLATTTFAANALYLGTYALALGGLAYAQSLFVDKPSVPKPEDGTFNLKQNVPSLAYVMGWSKKGGDYAFLEEKNGIAYHVIVAAAHEIEGYIQHYLHDEQVLLDETGFVAAPQHFTPNVVKILERTGLPAETAYPDLLTTFPTIYSEDHRGDGLASIMMSCRGVSQKNYMKVYPNQMPQWSAVMAGYKFFDPRTETVAFSRNIALMRLWHLTHPVGGKLSLDDVYLPDFAHAADVCAELVVNRDGENEPRYFGGFWFRANNDPTEVGRIMDQAAELVIFERPDGLVGCHAGEFVEPDITLTRNDVISFNLDGNTRDTSNVLAVRGRYVRLDLDHATSDAAIYGDPYVDGDDTERTKTIDNNAVQSHNHVQRLQKIAFIRANAPRVSILAHYEPAENVPYRRFVWVNIPPKLDMVLVEIAETPKLSLRNLTMEFAGIIVPADLYAFDAATEEGEPGNDVILLENGGVPTPTDFDVVIHRDTVSGSSDVAYGLASWAHYSDDLTYELEWQPSDESEPPRSILSEPEEDEVRSGYLIDGVSYRFRLRAWGGGTQSEWTDYVTRVAVADPVAPAALTVFTQTAAVPHLGNAVFSLTTANDTRLKSVKLYRKASGAPLDVDVDTPIATLPVASSIAATYGYTDGDASRANLVTNGTFGSDTAWTKGAGWTIAAGVAHKASGSATTLEQAIATLTENPAGVFRGYFEVSNIAGGSTRMALEGGTQSSGVLRTVNGAFLETLANNGNTKITIRSTAPLVCDIDNVALYLQTLSCVPQGAWDYYAVPVNGSGVAGPPSGPVAVAII